MNELSGTLRLPLKLSGEEQKLLREDPERAADLVHDLVEDSLRQQAAVRLLGALERRLELELGMNAEELAKDDWSQIGEKLAAAVSAEFAQRRARLIGSAEGAGDGTLAKEIAESLAKAEGPIDETHLLSGLMLMPESRVTAFDKKTHKQVAQRQRRLNFAYFAASLFIKQKTEAVTEKVLKHLQNAQRALQAVWGQAAWETVANSTPATLTESGKTALNEALGASGLENLNGRQLNELDATAKAKVVQALGKRSLSESYRQLLLRVITELWVDYLTRMEALRVSIRLEAYAQRDPLVEYKNQAFKMFQDLFADMRSSLVNRMFVFQPGPVGQTARAAALPPAAPSPNGGAAAAQVTLQQKQPPAAEASEGGGKRRRRRRKG
jgi:preprotein translocase subunit SecA